MRDNGRLTSYFSSERVLRQEVRKPFVRPTEWEVRLDLEQRFGRPADLLLQDVREDSGWIQSLLPWTITSAGAFELAPWL